MSESVTQPQTMESRELFVGAQIQSLVRDMSAFANNNPRFRRGHADYVTVTVGDADSLRPIEVESEADLDDDQISDDSQYECEMAFKFEAERHRRILWSKPVVWVEFCLTVAGIERNIELPKSIAETEYGLPGAESVLEAGLVRRTSMQMFRLHGRNRQIGLMEELDYFDSDGDSIVSVMTGQDSSKELIYISDEDGHDGSDEPRIEQYSSFQMDNRTDLTPFEFKIDDENTVALLMQMDEMGKDVDLMDLESNVHGARVAFENFKRAVLVQAGVLLPDSKDPLYNT